MNTKYLVLISKLILFIRYNITTKGYQIFEKVNEGPK